MENENFQNNFDAPSTNGTNGLAIGSLVVGIISIVISCCSPIVGIICGIVGIVLAVCANKKGATGMAKAGMICSIVGIVVAIVIWVLALVGVGVLSSLQELQ